MDALRNCGGYIAALKGRYGVNVDLIFKIAGIGIVVAILNLLLQRSGRDEQAMMTTIAGLIVVMMLLIGEIGTLFDTIREVFDL